MILNYIKPKNYGCESPKMFSIAITFPDLTMPVLAEISYLFFSSFSLA